MIKKIYLDTNVIISLFDKTRTDYAVSQSLVEYAIINEITLVISEDMLSTIFYIVKDKKSVLEFFKLIINDWHIVPFGKEVISAALDIALHNACDLEDVMQCLCAKKNGCDAVITNDKDFYSCDIACLSADEFMQSIV